MSDITMCVARECPYKDSCYRQQATPDPLLQSYADFSLTCCLESGFDSYIQNEKFTKQEEKV